MHAIRLALAAGALALVAAAPVAQTPPARAFTNLRLVDPVAGTVTPDAVLVVRDGRVAAAGTAAKRPAGAEETDLGGAYVTPGLIAAHVHVSDVHGDRPRAYTEENTLRQLRLYARYGVTSVLSLGDEQAPAFAVRDGGNPATLTRARLSVAGPVISARTPEEARAAVAKVAALRPDFIKFRVDDNLGTSTKMPLEVARAIIDEAHARNLPAAAHIFYLEDAKALLKAGVDMIAHSVRDREIDDEFVTLMKARNVPYCPTLTRELSTFVYESTPDFFSDPFFLRGADPDVVKRLSTPEHQEKVRASKTAQGYKAAVEVARKNLKRAADAGLLVVMGTDSGAFPERFQGYFEHVELEMMAEAGLTPARVLRSATADAAKGARLADVGTLTPGAWADFVAFERNPLDDVRNTRTLKAVWIAGNRVQ
ncbi:MAG TPA: amidohydrolase family protein [Vicinamibacterales bacterium]